MPFARTIPSIAALCLLAGSATAWAASGAANGPGIPLNVVPEAPAAPPEPTIDLMNLSVSSSINLKTGKVYHNLAIRGQLTIPPDSNLIGATYQLQLSALLDENKHDILTDPQGDPRMQVFAGNVRQGFTSVAHLLNDNNPNRTLPLTASLPMLTHLPQKITAIRGSATILLADKRVTQDIKPVRPGGLITITSGLVVQINKVTQDGSNLTIEFSYESDQINPFFNPNVEPFVAGVNLIDDKGAALPQRGWSLPNTRRENDMVRGDGIVKFRLDEGREPAMLRLDVVTRTREKKITVEANDLDLSLGRGGQPIRPQ
ncbi:MAG: hypothetical protein GC162_05425 [Planctomycetes bacterium]|nr:hypothetical protein [Planctomycetota bacterium]